MSDVKLTEADINKFAIVSEYDSHSLRRIISFHGEHVKMKAWVNVPGPSFCWEAWPSVVSATRIKKLFTDEQEAIASFEALFEIDCQYNAEIKDAKWRLHERRLKVLEDSQCLT